MLKIGLTGGIGSGKTVVAGIFNTLGIPVYYADDEAKRLMDNEPELISEITRIFGSGAYQNGHLDRAFIAGKAFVDKELLAKLNAVVHPVVQKDFLNWCDEHKDNPYIVEEAAILVESGGSKQFDYLVVVYADEDVRIQRVNKRDGLSENDIRSRMKRQMKSEELNQHADFLIDNNGSKLLIPQVLELHKKFVSLQVS